MNSPNTCGPNLTDCSIDWWHIENMLATKSPNQQKILIIIKIFTDEMLQYEFITFSQILTKNKSK